MKCCEYIDARLKLHGVWLSVKQERRPFLASECNELPKAEKWRRQVMVKLQIFLIIVGRTLALPIQMACLQIFFSDFFSMLTVKSQNNLGWKIIQFTRVFKAGPTMSSCLGPCPTEFEYLQGFGFHSFLGHLFQCLITFSMIFFFP